MWRGAVRGEDFFTVGKNNNDDDDDDLILGLPLLGF